MRHGQSSVEVVCAVTLLALLLSASTLVALQAWRNAELGVAELAARRAAARGHDPGQAAADAVPRLLGPAAHRAFGAR